MRLPLLLAAFSFFIGGSGSAHFDSEKSQGSFPVNASNQYESSELFRPDVSIGALQLLNDKNVSEELGRGIMSQLNDDDIPNITVQSSDGKQSLTVYLSPGASPNSFTEFEVNKLPSPPANMPRISSQEFITETGVKLGMTENEVLALKGKPTRITNDSGKMIEYEVSNDSHPSFLKEHNMPLYLASYQFKEGRLVSFRFGFPTP